MAFKIIAILALAIAAQVSSAPPAHLTWNEVVRSKHAIFPSKFEAVQSKSLNSAVVVAELKELLEDDRVFNAVYLNYLRFYNKETSRFRSLELRARFKQVLVEIAEHNFQYHQGTKTWTQGVNRMTDLSKTEFSRLLAPPNSIKVDPHAINTTATSFDIKQYKDISWKQYDSPVKSQGQCGSCFAFAVIAQLENHYNINNGIVTDLAEQQIVDCDPDSNGCGGGDAGQTIEYLKGGVSAESDYPYQGAVGQCQNAPKAAPKALTRSQKLGEANIAVHLQTGPTSLPITIDDAFSRYDGNGVMTDCVGGGEPGSHIVLVVALGTENGQQYYEIKNSWGNDVGDKGYWRIAAGQGTCGIGFLSEQMTSN